MGLRGCAARSQARFWASAVLVFIGMIVFWRAVYAWGFLGAFLVLSAVRSCSGGSSTSGKRALAEG